MRGLGELRAWTLVVWCGWLLVWGVCVWSSRAVAEEPVKEQVYAVAAVGSSTPPSSKLSERLIMPAGRVELGGEVAFVDGDAPDMGGALELTDLALARLRARRAFGERLELYAASALLLKRPPGLRTPVFQGGDLGARVGVLDPLAVTLDVGAGPLVGDPGLHLRVQPGLLVKPAIDRKVRFELGLGVASTALAYNASNGGTAWLHELALGAEVQLANYDCGVVVGFGYRVPLAARGVTPGASALLHPGPQLDLHVGGFLLVGRDDSWDLFVIYGVIDRGDVDRPGTTLPIVDGGFDQRQLVLGVQHRFE